MDSVILKDATTIQMVEEFASRGLHGVVAVNAFLMKDVKSFDEPSAPGASGGVFMFGHPVAVIGLADQALQNARQYSNDSARRGPITSPASSGAGSATRSVSHTANPALSGQDPDAD